MRVKSFQEIRDKSLPMSIYDLNFWIYVHSGFWPYEFPSKIKNIVFRVLKVFLTVFYCGTVTCFLVDAYLVRKDPEKFSFNMSSSLLVYLTDIKMLLLKNKKKEFDEVLESLDKNFGLERIGESPEEKKIFFDKAKDLLRITRIFYYALLIIYPLRIISNTALGSKTYVIPIPFTDILEPYYEYIYAQQVVVTGHFLIAVICHDMLIYGVIIRFIAHFQVLQSNFMLIKKLYPRKDYKKYVPGYSESEEEKNTVSNILICKMNGLDKIQILLKEYGFHKLDAMNKCGKNDNRDEKTCRILKDCIRHHQKLLKEIKQFCILYSDALLIQTVAVGFFIGIVALHIIILSSQITILLAQQTLFVITSLINVYYFCTFGSEITSQSEETANALYDLPWYEMDIENRKTLAFVLKNLMKGPVLRGGGMIIINRETYLKLLQTSYNMVAVLKNAY